MREEYDFVIVGGGAVGLHAALKAAVLRHTALIVDKGRSFARVSQAPSIANIPGLPGISGPALLDRLRKDLGTFADLSEERLVTVWDDAEAHDAKRTPEGDFVVHVGMKDGANRAVRGRVLVLATGLVDRKPGIEHFHQRGHATLAPFLHRGAVGYCILCEGWDLKERKVGVVGCTDDSVHIAIDVRKHFGGDVTLLLDGGILPDETREPLASADVHVERRPILRFAEHGDDVRVELDEQQEVVVEKLLFTLGQYRVNNELAVLLGGATTSEGYVLTDENSEVLDKQGERIPGLFAIGDLRAARWKQIVVGWGDAETAVITAYARRLPQ